MSSHLKPLFPYLRQFHPVPDDYFDPTKSAAWLESIYSFLLLRKQVNNIVPLKELRNKLGEWERQPPMGLAAGWECFEGRNKRCFILGGVREMIARTWWRSGRSGWRISMTRIVSTRREGWGDFWIGNSGGRLGMTFRE
jgi:hypothetical protein